MLRQFYSALKSKIVVNLLDNGWDNTASAIGLLPGINVVEAMACTGLFIDRIERFNNYSEQWGENGEDLTSFFKGLVTPDIYGNNGFYYLISESLEQPQEKVTDYLEGHLRLLISLGCFNNSEERVTLFLNALFANSFRGSAFHLAMSSPNLLKTLLDCLLFLKCFSGSHALVFLDLLARDQHELFNLAASSFENYTLLREAIITAGCSKAAWSRFLNTVPGSHITMLLCERTPPLLYFLDYLAQLDAGQKNSRPQNLS
ncbi:MAG: hypothetical protein PSV35_07550, partial [bacterium]|nr:hypothetical protein [bacterium]